MKKYETCPQGLDWRDWRKFLDLVEHHKQRSTINRAPAAQPAGVTQAHSRRPTLSTGLREACK